MTYETKLNLLKSIILNNDYNIELYRLINNHNLKNVISNINEQSLMFNNIELQNELTAKFFLTFLNDFVNVMKTNFYHLKDFEYIINNLVTTNIDLIEKYFNDFDSKNEEEYINKIIVTNFISNSNYSKLIKDLLKQNNLKNNDYKNIVILLSNIIYYQKDNFDTFILFEKIDNSKNKLSLQQRINDYERILNNFIINFNNKK